MMAKEGIREINNSMQLAKTYLQNAKYSRRKRGPLDFDLVSMTILLTNHLPGQNFRACASIALPKLFPKSLSALLLY